MTAEGGGVEVRFKLEFAGDKEGEGLLRARGESAVSRGDEGAEVTVVDEADAGVIAGSLLTLSISEDGGGRLRDIRRCTGVDNPGIEIGG